MFYLQDLTLAWKDVDHDDKNNTLDRNLTLSFAKNESSGFYGIIKVMGSAEIR